MDTNFDFLKKIDNELYEISVEAEKLYRDEYFSQCIAQSRKFGEAACKKILGKKITSESTFDDMINMLKDNFPKSPEQKELIDDLYFIKKEGNCAVHGSVLQKDGMKALECLRRMFELAINYSTFKNGFNSHISLLKYDEELLILGKKRKNTLQEKYIEKKRELEQKNYKKKQKNGIFCKNSGCKKSSSQSPSKSSSSVIGTIIFALIAILYLYIKFFVKF